MKIRYCVIFLSILWLLPALGIAQCLHDLFGRWESLDKQISFETPEFKGKYFEPQTCTISNDKIEISGDFYLQDRKMIITGFSTSAQGDSNQVLLRDYHLDFSVRRNTSQQLILKPINDKAIELCGNAPLELFNKDFIAWDNIDLRALYFSFLGNKYVVDLEAGVVHKKQRYGAWRKNKYKYYTSDLNAHFLDTLKVNILKSKIIYMSVCDRKWKSASDTYPKFIAIDYNDRVINFTTYYIYDSVYPLYINMWQIDKDLKWKRTKDTDTEEREFEYFYHYGRK